MSETKKLINFLSVGVQTPTDKTPVGALFFTVKKLGNLVVVSRSMD